MSLCSHQLWRTETEIRVPPASQWSIKRAGRLARSFVFHAFPSFNLQRLVFLTANLVLGNGMARGQDALRSAISLQPVISPTQAAPVDLRPDRPHLGPVQFTLGAYTGVELNDNVNSSQVDPQSDLLLRGGVTMGLLWPATTQSELRFGSSFGYVHYLRNSQYDHLEVAPDSALSWAVGFDDGTITFFDQFSYSQQVLAESAISGIATFPRFNNTVGARVDWLPGRWALEAGYSHNDSFSDSTQFQYLNSSSEYFFARGGWRFAETTQAGIEASSSFTSYELATQPGNYNFSFGPYADWQFTQSLHASLRGGPVIYVFDSQPSASQGKTLDAYYLGFDVSHRLTDFLSHRINIQRDVRQGLNRGSSYIQELVANYSVSLSLTGRVTLGTGFTYEQGTQPFETPVNIFPFGTFYFQSLENYNRYGATLSASWQATEKLAATLAYSYYLRDSSVKGNGYTVNSLSLNVSFTF